MGNEQLPWIMSSRGRMRNELSPCSRCAHRVAVSTACSEEGDQQALSMLAPLMEHADRTDTSPHGAISG